MRLLQFYSVIVPFSRFSCLWAGGWIGEARSILLPSTTSHYQLLPALSSAFLLLVHGVESHLLYVGSLSGNIAERSLIRDILQLGAELFTTWEAL
ncbi:hypothetical protein SDJN03_06721, partial [Cucurbita argyrosperma subsp. sororia]